MQYKLVIQPEAEQDITEAVVYYEQQKKGLGFQLLDAFNEQFARIQSNPLHYSVKYRDVHVSFLLQYKFGIHYRILDDIILIVMVIHTSRDPKRWIKRIK